MKRFIVLFMGIVLVQFVAGCGGKAKEDPAQTKAMFDAVNNNDVEGLAKAIKAGANVNALDQEGYIKGGTAIMYAVQNENLDAVKAILEAKPNLNVIATNGENALSLAVSRGNIEIAKLLLDAGTPLKIGDSAGNTPLMFAAWSGNTNMVNLLLKYKADVNATNLFGATALSWARDSKLADVEKILIAAGAK